jgi:molecular chaperone GrpE (heat shock protein)
VSHDKEFPITEKPQPLIEWGDGDILGKCYNNSPAQTDETIRKSRRLRYFRQAGEKERVVTRLIPLADSLDRLLANRDEAAIESTPILRNWYNTMKALRTRLLAIMEREGLVSVDSVGKTVDLNVHKVVEVKGSNEGGTPVVVEEYEKGYMLDNRVIRDATVAVRRVSTEDALTFQREKKALKQE